MINLTTIEEAVKPRIFYAESSTPQIFTPSQINHPSSPANNLVVFDQPPILNSNDFITFDPATSTFTATITGIYEVSTFVNYNPLAAGVSENVQDRTFLNIRILRSTNNGASWEDVMASRAGWGEESA